MIVAGDHYNVLADGRTDINGRIIVICHDCSASGHAVTEEQALLDLATARCAPYCFNCKALRHSHDRKPAVPVDGSVTDLIHVCPFDGNRWWQYNTHWHLWKHVTSGSEWEHIRFPSQELDMHPEWLYI